MKTIEEAREVYLSLRFDVRYEGERVLEGWSVTDCDPPGRVHIYFREGNNIQVFNFYKKDLHELSKWSTEDVS